MLDGFVIDEQGGTLHIRNAPSPAATSSLAIAEMIVDSAVRNFHLASL
jgi:(S)-2-hydroxyglutarate dehydrogenase